MRSVFLSSSRLTTQRSLGAFPMRCFSTGAASVLDQPASVVARSSPSACKLLYQNKIDFVNKGSRPLRQLCGLASVVPKKLQEALEAVKYQEEVGAIDNDPLRGSLAKEWDAVNKPEELVQHIKDTFHNPSKTSLPALTKRVNQLAEIHGGEFPGLLPLAKNLERFTRDFGNHMMVEERSLFSRVLGHNELPKAQWEAATEDHVKSHHVTHLQLERIRIQTDDYTPEEGMPEELVQMFSDLADMDWEVHVHTHLENNILFPALGHK
eukprot:gb/GEZN01011104.1/.p1 GENE.gb/GEZN01011104.1/~~gb/GEZN01011104.1/.p1  ORF type:complete len:274 (+),score=45.54 gb/GEZN01011104.1/:27-824(+)